MAFLVVHDGPGACNTDDSRQPDCPEADSTDRPHLHLPTAAAMPRQGHETRRKEYDNMNGDRPTYIEDEVLPRVEKNCKVKPDRRPRRPGGDGQQCPAARSAPSWLPGSRNDLYHRVLTTSGTFVNQAWPFDSKFPDGAWGFHETLIPKETKKPIRIFFSVGDKDLLNPNVMKDDMHDWVEANHRMAKVLKEKGYEYQYLFCRGQGHGIGGRPGAVLAKARSLNGCGKVTRRRKRSSLQLVPGRRADLRPWPVALSAAPAGVGRSASQPARPIRSEGPL